MKNIYIFASIQEIKKIYKLIYNVLYNNHFTISNVDIHAYLLANYFNTNLLILQFLCPVDLIHSRQGVKFYIFYVDRNELHDESWEARRILTCGAVAVEGV